MFLAIPELDALAQDTLMVLVSDEEETALEHMDDDAQAQFVADKVFAGDYITSEDDMTTDHQYADALGHIITERAKAHGLGGNAWTAGNALSRGTGIPTATLFPALAAQTTFTDDDLESIAEHLGTEVPTLLHEARTYADLAAAADAATRGL